VPAPSPSPAPSRCGCCSGGPPFAEPVEPVEPSKILQIIDDFLTPEECDEIIKIAEEVGLKPSTVYQSSEETHKSDTVSRISEQVWLKDSQSEIVKKIESKVSELSGMPIKNQEDLQVVKYVDNGFFKNHWDLPDSYKKYQRYMTFLMYLNDDFEGGETVFPKLQTTVFPKKGRVAIFYNSDLEGNKLEDSLHSGNIVKGTKWICTKWVSSADSS
jgi:prolyl 4-hydroxylase